MTTGAGTTGTIINNAWKQELYNQIDALAGGDVTVNSLSSVTFVGVGTDMAVTGVAYLNGPVSAGRYMTVAEGVRAAAFYEGARATPIRIRHQRAVCGGEFHGELGRVDGHRDESANLALSARRQHDRISSFCSRRRMSAWPQPSYASSSRRGSRRHR